MNVLVRVEREGSGWLRHGHCRDVRGHRQPMHAASNFLVIEHLYLQLGPAAGGRMSLRVVLLLRRAMTLGVVLLLPFLQIVNACVSIPASKVVSYADPSSRFQLSIVVAE